MSSIATADLPETTSNEVRNSSKRNVNVLKIKSIVITLFC